MKRTRSFCSRFQFTPNTKNDINVVIKCRRNRKEDSRVSREAKENHVVSFADNDADVSRSIDCCAWKTQRTPVPSSIRAKNRNVSNVAASTFAYYFKYAVTHPIVLMLVLPLAILYFVADQLGSYEQQVTAFENVIAFVVWWLGLGIVAARTLCTSSLFTILTLCVCACLVIAPRTFSVD